MNFMSLIYTTSEPRGFTFRGLHGIAGLTVLEHLEVGFSLNIFLLVGRKMHRDLEVFELRNSIDYFFAVKT